MQKIMNLPDILKKKLCNDMENIPPTFSPRNRRGKKTTVFLSLGQACEANLFENVFNLSNIYFALK